MSNVYQRDLQISIPTFWRAATSGGYAYQGVIAWDTGQVLLGYVRINNDYTTTVVTGSRVFAAAGMAATPSAWQWIPVTGGGLTSLYRVDFPIAAWAAGARYVVPYVESNSGTVFFQPMETHMLVADDLAATRTTDAQIADKLLARSIKGGSDVGTGPEARSVGNALAAVRNRVVRSGNTLTVYDTNDTTPLWTATVTGFSGNVEMEPA